MSNTPDPISKLLRQGESALIEFKAMVPSPISLSQLIGSFANAAGGIILIGVQEPTSNRALEEIVTDVDVQTLKNNFDAALRRLNPVPDVRLDIVQVAGKKLGLISIDRSKRLVVSDSGIFTRKRSGVVPMPWREIEEASLASSDLRTEIRRLAEVIEEQSSNLRDQSDEIEKMKQELAQAGSLRNKLIDWFVGGVIGAIIGVAVTLI